MIAIVAGAWFTVWLGLLLAMLIFAVMCVAVAVEYTVAGLVCFVRALRRLAR